jgi:hypothetical protein
MFSDLFNKKPALVTILFCIVSLSIAIVLSNDSYGQNITSVNNLFFYSDGHFDYGHSISEIERSFDLIRQHDFINALKVFQPAY